VNDRRVGRSGVDGAHPFGERVLVAGQVLDHPGEPGNMPDGGVQLGAADPERAQPRRIVRLEVPRKTGDPAGDLPHRRRPWVRRQPRERGRVDAAQRPQVTRQGLIAARVTALGDLNMQHRGIALAPRPAGRRHGMCGRTIYREN
jgi:hypothetical protein